MLRILATALFALFFCLSGVGSANAQQAVAISSCGTIPTPLTVGIAHVLYMDSTGVLCTSSSGGGGGGTSSAFGSALPATGTAAGFSDGTNMVAGRVTAGALSSAFTPPTSGLQQVQSFGMVWNGSTWDRATAASGGLSIQDQAAFTGGTSNFTPAGGVFNDAATLSSGQQGTMRLTTKRAAIVDVDTAGNALYSALTASIPAGTNLIGKVGIDQTTPGTTNAVSATNFPSAVATGTGAQGATVPRFTVATDSATVAGSATLPAGTNTVGNVGSDPSSGKATPTEAFLALPATTTTQIIALSGSTKTYVTSAVVLAGGTVNVTFKYGTGSNCGTGTTTLNGPWPLTAQAGFSKGSGLGAVMIVPAGQALCITTDDSVTGGVDLTYQQF